VAEFDLDALLSTSLRDAAVAGDSAGVADVIRARVAAGDTGTPASGPEAPGWAGLGRPGWFWPLVTVVAGLAGVLAVLVAVLLWPATQPVATTQPLPTGSAPLTPTSTPTLTPTPTPTPTSAPTPTPSSGPVAPPPPPPPPADAAPAIQQISADPAAVGCAPGSTISVLASDDRRVSGVALSWNGPSSGSGPMVLQSGVWTLFIPMSSGTGTYTITAVARDSADQPSAPASIGVLRDICIS
jgi:hypothetical protein